MNTSKSPRGIECPCSRTFVGVSFHVSTHRHQKSRQKREKEPVSKKPVIPPWSQLGDAPPFLCVPFHDPGLTLELICVLYALRWEGKLCFIVVSIVCTERCLSVSVWNQSPCSQSMSIMTKRISSRLLHLLQILWSKLSLLLTAYCTTLDSFWGFCRRTW